MFGMNAVEMMRQREAEVERLARRASLVREARASFRRRARKAR